MRTASRPHAHLRPSLPFVLLCLFAAVLWLAGGASRADAMGQVVVRLAAALVLLAMIAFAPRPALGSGRPVAYLLGAAILLALMQLVPLPPGVWQMLPGRAPFAQAALLSGEPQPWRPWTIVRGATVNAAASLFVPLAMLVVVAGSKETERRWLPGLLLSMIAASTFVGLLQFSGAALDNPLVNEAAGQVSGTFANRNHFALLLALGCLVAPVWAFLDGGRPGWRGPVALGLVLLFAMTILASGSRGGMLVGVLGLGVGLMLAQQGMRRTLSRYPRWAFPALIGGVVALIAIFVLLSIAADRAVSVDRLLASDAGNDMRSRGLPTVFAMIRAYFPVGSGLGGFDPVFRMHEPFDLLKFTYFNHAHNDWLEVVLDAGLPGLLLLAAAVLWWGWASVRAWRARAGEGRALPRLGSAMLLLVMIASAFDYPARTPIMMATIVLASLWLSGGEARRASALPTSGQHL